ncbi:MAG: nitroreductase family protein [Solobacterium sp.]|nr:nitroreductase family protein [Solobacterium sp.]
MEFTDVVKNRYSCKVYSDRAVESEKLQAVLEAGRVAPTAKNLQEQRIYVIQSQQMLKKIDECTVCRYGAPVVIAVAYDRNNVYSYPGDRYNSGAEDATIVATQMILAAYNEGLGSCWLNRFDPDETAKALGLPENETIVMLMDIGYPGEGGVPLAKHFDRKPLEETVTYL